MSDCSFNHQPCVAELIQTNQLLYPVIHRDKTCTVCVSHGRLPPVPLCVFCLLPSCFLEIDLHLLLCVRERAFVCENRLTAYAGVKVFSLTSCQITGHLTDEHLCAVKPVEAIPLLACHIFQHYTPPR